MTGYIEPMLGRYVHVEIDREMHRIYFEENGAVYRWFACIPRARTEGSGGICWQTKSSQRIPHHRVRHALAWQVESATEWTGENIA